jgi:hypothetical protein
MTDVATRLMAQAALTSAPDTLVSAEEVAMLLELELAYVIDRVPEGVRRGRASWSAWRLTLGFDAEPEERAPEAVLLPESRPFTTWRAIARVVGVSHDTLLRRRKAVGDTTPPRFPNREAVRAWWEALHSPAPTSTRGKPKSPPARGLTLADVRGQKHGKR